LLRDDGAMVYINNNLVFRSNMPEGEVTALTVASSVVGGEDESTFFPQLVDPAVLVAGTNIVAVEVHQQNPSSSDVSFDLRLEGLVASSNRPPTANAGPDLTVVAGEAVFISGGFSDDGLPASPGVAVLTWTQSEGPAPATIAGANASRPTVTFPVAGRYVLRLAVNDGLTTVADSVTVTVTAGEQETYQAWRERHFSAAELGNPAISGDSADPDGDGQTNRNEYESGTLPRDASSVLRLRWMVAVDGSLKFSVRVANGRTYTLQSRDDVAGAGWQTMLNLDTATCDCEVEVPWTRPPGSIPAQFYRVVTPRAP
jgi:hypothetical protein